MDLHRTIKRVGEMEALDELGEPLSNLIGRIAPHKSVMKDLLSGTWLGHQLHPMLTDIPIGSFTSATVLDLIGGADSEHAADLLVDLGLLASIPTALAGAADWSDTQGEDKRVGVAHALANVVGIGFYAASALARRRGRRGAATVFGLSGMASMSAGGYLGGYLSFGRGIGVNNAFLEEAPEDWTTVTSESDLVDGEVKRVDAGGATVLVYRKSGQTFAISSRCSHAGGPLEEGDIDAAACTVTCPWHQSEFRLDNGEVVHGPATVPQTAYDTRIIDGEVQVRPHR